MSDHKGMLMMENYKNTHMVMAMVLHGRSFMNRLVR
jgi:hypothetical protein